VQFMSRTFSDFRMGFALVEGNTMHWTLYR
jgi:hypothetical protein